MYIRHKILNFVSLYCKCCAFKRHYNTWHAFPPAHTGLSDVFILVRDFISIFIWPESAAPDSPGATEPRSYWNTEIKGTLSPALKSTVIFKRPGCRQLQWRWESTSILELNLNVSVWLRSKTTQNCLSTFAQCLVLKDKKWTLYSIISSLCWNYIVMLL